MGDAENARMLIVNQDADAGFPATDDLLNPMKTPAIIFSTGLVLLISSPVSHAVITAYSADFSGDDTSLSDFFKSATNGAVAGAAWSATGGVGGGGGVLVTNGTQNNFFYRPDSSSFFNLASLTTGQGYRSSADFYWSGPPISTELTVVTMGFSTGNTASSALSANGSLAGSLIRTAGSTDLTLRIRFDNGTAPGSLAFRQETLSPGSWYRLQFDMLKASSTTFNTMVTLYSIGADGLGTPVAVTYNSADVSISGTITAASLAADVNAHSAFDVRANNSITALDNLNVSFIPEPASAGLLALGVAAIGLRRRKG